MRTQVSFNSQCSNCCTAAACSSAQITQILDTALQLAVSIFLCIILFG